MPGKRPRQIQRTTSMSHLGAAPFPNSFHNDAFAPLRGQSCPPQQESFHTSLEPCAEVGESQSQSLYMKQNGNLMAIDSCAEESLVASRPVWPYQAVSSGSEALSNVYQDAQSSYLPHRSYNKVVESHTMPSRRNVEAGSSHATQPRHFLDICYLCSKLLGHGRDVFIYRGDRAFCSVECRHLQIMADERREKGVLRNAKDGSAVSAQVNDSPSANQVETVAAA